jgi:pimeloyl-ACP methyl ester carboxylesterase
MSDFSPRAKDSAPNGGVHRDQARLRRFSGGPRALIHLGKRQLRVPTLVIHRKDDVTINVEGGRYLAEHIPGARYIELPGKDHLPFVGDNAGERANQDLTHFLE